MAVGVVIWSQGQAYVPLLSNISQQPLTEIHWHSRRRGKVIQIGSLALLPQILLVGLFNCIHRSARAAKHWRLRLDSVTLCLRGIKGGAEPFVNSSANLYCTWASAGFKTMVRLIKTFSQVCVQSRLKRGGCFHILLDFALQFALAALLFIKTNMSVVYLPFNYKKEGLPAGSEGCCQACLWVKQQSSSFGVFKWWICMKYIYHLFLHPRITVKVISRHRRDASWHWEATGNAAGVWEAQSAHLLEVVQGAAGRLPPDGGKRTERGFW